MSEERIRYRRLPGRRRGFLRGASVWLAPDHLLLVRSMRFREEYKRFHLRDIQAISVAAAPRVHFSVRAFLIALVWLAALIVAASVHKTWFIVSVWVVAAALAGTWLYVSLSASCICRIYTAVSGDDLPSVYRSWTARKFMRQVASRIAEAQGVVEGEWAQAVEDRQIGPREPTPMEFAGGGAPSSVAPQGSPASAAARPILPWIFAALMFADAVLTYLTKPQTSVAFWRTGYSVLALELGVSIALLVQHSRGKLMAGMQKLVIVSLIATGIVWYFNRYGTIVTGAAMSASGNMAGTLVAINDFLRMFDAIAHLVWGLIAIALIAANGRSRQMNAPLP
jgi:hypothetical protein